jgi:primosomal protein N' (replication factor Y) (superfamily II helicase)
MNSEPDVPILQVAIPSPLHGSLDYLPPPHCSRQALRPGMRVQVPFGKRKTVGVLVQIAAQSRIASQRLRPALSLLDQEPLLGSDLLELSAWASRYYHHPLGEVMSALLPAALRSGQTARPPALRMWRVTAAGKTVSPTDLRRAPRQAALLNRLQQSPDGIGGSELSELETTWRGAMRALLEKGWAEFLTRVAPPAAQEACAPQDIKLNDAQHKAVDAVGAALGGFASFLLDGVTGSGKTEVYLQIISRVIAAGRQALLLVPEIGLTPQLINRFSARLGHTLAVLHSGLTDSERLQAWLLARNGQAPIIIGTRSAVFTPLLKPGIIIIDEEHDLSFKQQDGFRYHARDVAVWRARQLGIPVVLGSATPSFETLYNIERGRYRRLDLPARAGEAKPPRLRTIDMRSQKLEGNLSPGLLQAMARHLEQGNQVLLFLNRRGFAPTLLCHDCGWVAQCRRCDAHLTYHHGQRRLRCHHCGAEQAMPEHCPACNGTELHPLGHGTERVEQALRHHFPQFSCARIDRDSTRRKGALQQLLDDAHSGHHRILLGTQMLAKGHHFPNVTLAAILDGDQGLFGFDFRAGERMAQLITQVAGRAGRAAQAGEVMIQTHHPEHPLLRTLLTEGYHRYAAAALAERREAELPPYVNLVLLRAEATTADAPTRFLDGALRLANALGTPGVTLLGPIPSPMERRAGRYRAQLLVQAVQRADLHRLLDAWLPPLGQLPAARKVRWSVDVDPMEMI